MERKPARKARRTAVFTDAPKAVTKWKRTLVLSDETWERLGIHAGRHGENRSESAEALLSVPLRRYVVSEHPGRVAPDEAQDPSRTAA